MSETRHREGKGPVSRLREMRSFRRARPTSRQRSSGHGDRIYSNMVTMKTTIDIPDDLFRETKARAALRGESLKDFVCGALEERLSLESSGELSVPGWRKVFGCVTPEDVAEIDAVIAREFGTVDPSEWEE